MKFLKYLLIIVGLVIVAFGGFIGFVILTDYNPPKTEKIIVGQNSSIMMSSDETFTLTTFNIGYCGLDETQDFFMDGGKRSKSESYEKTMENYNAIAKFLTRVGSDFYFLQEVDVKSKRSYNINEVKLFNELLNDYSSSFALNYVAKWVPMPIFDQMGYVKSGMVTYSKYLTGDSLRYSLPIEEKGIVRYFDLVRAMIETIIPLESGKKLYLVNIHLSAYDKGGVIKKKQTKYIIDYVKRVYNENNYIIIGGDWNQLLAPKLLAQYGESVPYWLGTLPEEIYTLGFNVAFDSTTNTVRDLDSPYVKGETFETVIDGFLISPNIEIINTKTHDLGFKNGDHNPVTVTLKFMD
jgi:endonuclease/exonuclease/phosphatase family metal-dependent hydrolase